VYKDAMTTQPRGEMHHIMRRIVRKHPCLEPTYR